MLAVILTKSFRCLFHSKVYISLFFCVLELCFWYSLCACVCVCARVCMTAYKLSAVKGPFQRYKGDKETLVLCKWKI